MAKFIKEGNKIVRKLKLTEETKEKIKEKIKELEEDGYEITTVLNTQIYYKNPRAENKAWYPRYHDVPYNTLEVKVMDVTVRDEEGNEYKKEVTVEQVEREKPILSFGGWCRYYLEDMEEERPFEDPFCIDAMGRNHGGIPGVRVSAQDLERIFEKIEELEKEGIIEWR